MALKTSKEMHMHTHKCVYPYTPKKYKLALQPAYDWNLTTSICTNLHDGLFAKLSLSLLLFKLLEDLVMWGCLVMINTLVTI
jgi:hypothetical protein